MALDLFPFFVDISFVYHQQDFLPDLTMSNAAGVLLGTGKTFLTNETAQFLFLAV
jgi:hypothetical protein